MNVDQHRADFIAASISWSILKLLAPIAGRTALPASVIKPSFSKRRTRSLFRSVHGLFFFLGENLCIRTPSMITKVLSIQPKQRASSTASMYQKVSESVGFPRFTSTQHSGSEDACSMNHERNSWRLSGFSMFLCVIYICFLCRFGYLLVEEVITHYWRFAERRSALIGVPDIATPQNFYALSVNPAWATHD